MSKKSYGNKLVLVIFAFLLAGMYIVLFKQLATLKYVNPSSSAIERTNTYRSNILEMSVTVSDGFEVEESGNFITLTSDEGTIHIDRISTNENSIRAYVQKLREKNNINVQEHKAQYFRNVEVLETMIEDSDLTYFLSPKLGRIFSLSTTSPELYDDLEKIVQSFEYLGE